MRALAIVRRDLLRYARNPGRTALLFAIPLVLAGLFTMVFGGGGVDAVSIKVLVYDEDDSLLSRFLDGATGSPEMDERLELVPVGPEGFEMMENGEASALVHIPKGFSADFLAGRETVITVVKNPAHRFLPQIIEEGVDIGAVILSQASYVFRPELEQVSAFTESEVFPTDRAMATLSTGVNSKVRELERFLLPPVITLETSTVDAENSGAGLNILAIILPGLSVMGIFFLAQSATRDMLRDRESGLLRHLLTSPISAGDYLLGKSLSVLVVTTTGFVILVLLGLAAGVDWGSPLATAALVLATSLAASGTLLLIMSAVGSERQGDAVTTIVIISWSMLGGAFIPMSEIPDFVHPISATSLVYWSTDAFTTLIVDHGTVADIGLNLMVLVGFGAAFMAAGMILLHRRIERGA